MIAARIAEIHGGKPQPVPAHTSTLAALSERRTGQDRREAELESPPVNEDRRFGAERRNASLGPTGAGFGRRTARPN